MAKWKKNLMHILWTYRNAVLEILVVVEKQFVKGNTYYLHLILGNSTISIYAAK